MNQEIAVTSFYFAQGNSKKSFPRRIETPEGKQINFIEDGLRCVVRKGQDLLEIFMMSDGLQQYKLGHETQQNSWKLMSTHSL